MEKVLSLLSPRGSLDSSLALSGYYFDGEGGVVRTGEVALITEGI
jgi:hypothetical protein